MTAATSAASPGRVIVFLLAVVVAYALSFLGGYPQRWTTAAVTGHVESQGDEANADDGHAAAAHPSHDAEHDHAGPPPP
ncbi:MAG TPA: hypothetical protein PKC18_09955, partial [Lacipirellulaceae bacterium]|nr:hypothetical protein [Lacipirellulaceae bacterium]